MLEIADDLSRRKDWATPVQYPPKTARNIPVAPTPSPRRGSGRARPP
jgi:hypothetical protein